MISSRTETTLMLNSNLTTNKISEYKINKLKICLDENSFKIVNKQCIIQFDKHMTEHIIHLNKKEDAMTLKLIWILMCNNILYLKKSQSNV